MNKTNRGSGRFLLWLALVLLLAGLIALGIVLNGDPLFVVNNRFALEASTCLLVLGAIVLFRHLFRAQITARPTVRAGLLTGALLSLALLFTGVGWVFLVAVPIGGLTASRGVALMPTGPAKRRPGAMAGVRVAAVGWLVLWLLGVPAALVTGQIWANDVVATAPPDVADAMTRFVPDVFGAALLFALVAIPLVILGVFVGNALFRRRPSASQPPEVTTS